MFTIPKWVVYYCFAHITPNTTQFINVNPGSINHGLLIRGVRTLRHTRFLQEHCCYSEPLQGSQHRQLWGQIGAFGLRGDDFQRYHLVMTNIAMERPTMLLIGKAR